MYDKKKKKYRINNIYKRDIKNIINYGFSAPRFAERLWIDPRQCYFDQGEEGFGLRTTVRLASGKVWTQEWPYEKASIITNNPKIKACIEHWEKGIPWENTGIYEIMLFDIKKKGKLDGCKNLEDIIKRYHKLDQVFKEIKELGYVKTRKELNNKNFRESGDPVINIGPNGELFLQEEDIIDSL